MYVSVYVSHVQGGRKKLAIPMKIANEWHRTRGPGGAENG